MELVRGLLQLGLVEQTRCVLLRRLRRTDRIASRHLLVVKPVVGEDSIAIDLPGVSPESRRLICLRRLSSLARDAGHRALAVAGFIAEHRVLMALCHRFLPSPHRQLLLHGFCTEELLPRPRGTVVRLWPLPCSSLPVAFRKDRLLFDLHELVIGHAIVTGFFGTN